MLGVLTSALAARYELGSRCEPDDTWNALCSIQDDHPEVLDQVTDAEAPAAEEMDDELELDTVIPG